MSMTDVLNSNPFLNSHFNNGAEGMLVHLVGAEIGFAAQCQVHRPLLARIDAMEIVPDEAAGGDAA
jgi:hypothetical protein